MFLEYWGKPDATREKFIGDWMTTGDQGVVDDDGYIHVHRPRRRRHHVVGLSHRPGRDRGLPDPHPAVALAAAVGKPDPIRTEIVKAFIVLKTGLRRVRRARRRDPGASCKTRLSAHEYPREVAFIAQMPMTTTGKVIRRLLRQQA